MTVRLATVAVLSLLFCTSSGCDGSAATIHLVFPSPAAAERAASLTLLAVAEDAVASCEAIAGADLPGEKVLARRELTDLRGTLVFGDLPLRKMLVSALIRDGVRKLFAAGCSAVDARPGRAARITIELQCLVPACGVGGDGGPPDGGDLGGDSGGDAREDAGADGEADVVTADAGVDIAPDLEVDSGPWSALQTGVVEDLNGVWAFSAAQAYAVGDDGTILRRAGNTFTADSSPTSVDLHGVWGLSATWIYAVGDSGTLLGSDGSSWYSIWSSGPDLRRIRGTYAGNIWISGDGVVYRHVGTQFVADLVQPNVVFYDIYAPSATNAWAVGSDRVAVRKVGTSWYSAGLPDVVNVHARAVCGISNGWMVWVGDSAGHLWRFYQTGWSDALPGGTEPIYGLWAHSATSVAVVGANGLARFGGESTSLTSAALHDVWGVEHSGQLVLHVVGASGVAFVGSF